MSVLAYLVIGAFILVGFAVACYACCACPSGQLDGVFEDDFDYAVEREIAKEMKDN